MVTSLFACASTFPERDATPGEFASYSTIEHTMPTKRVAPLYPRRAVRAGVEGTLTVHLTISGSGRVEEIEVVSSEPPGIFGRAVRTAVRSWRFEPIVLNGYQLRRRAIPYTFVFDLYPCEQHKSGTIQICGQKAK